MGFAATVFSAFGQLRYLEPSNSMRLRRSPAAIFIGPGIDYHDAAQSSAANLAGGRKERPAHHGFTQQN